MRRLNLVVWSAIFLSVLQPQTSRAADEKAALEKTRKELRAKGFKTDLTDFNFSATSDEFTRSAAIKAADPSAWSPVNRFHASGLFSDLNMRSMITSNTALVVWKMENIGTPGVEPQATWGTLHELLDENAGKLDSLAQALATGRYAFDLNAQAGNSMLLPHLAVQKIVTQAFAARAMLELHDGHPAAAWSNVVAATRISTRWRVEPVEISHMVQCAVAAIAADAMWQALQTNCWSDEQLASLQKEWQTPDWFADFPQMLAFQGASAAHLCQMDRTNSQNMQLPIGDALRHPTEAVQELKYYQQQRDYRAHGSYEDEKALLEFHFDREQEMRKVLQCKSWVEMRPMPLATNPPVFRSKYRSSVSMQVNRASMTRMMSARDGMARTIIGRAAETEARRRVVVTALALERFRLKNKTYPEKLAQLAPDYLPTEPIDFCDGKPLRYHRTEERFVLYSVGLDCVDDGGLAALRKRGDYASRTNSVERHEDLVWLQPASDKDMAEKQRNDALEEQRRTDAMLQARADYRKLRETKLQSLRPQLAKLYAEQKSQKFDEPKLHGQELSKVIRNDVTLGDAKPALYDLLTLRPVQNSDGPESVTYELPIKFDSLKADTIELRLLVDFAETADNKANGYGDLPEFGEAQNCRRAANGNCLLTWNTTFDPPGEHFVQALLICFGLNGRGKPDEFCGPLTMYRSTNLCEFDGGYSESINGEAIFWAKLAEPKGECSIELKTPAGDHIKTLNASTTNSEIRIKWDWLDDRGRKSTNGTIDTFYTIKLSESGRTQTLRGP
jgi:hypothetical protein